MAAPSTRHIEPLLPAAPAPRRALISWGEVEVPNAPRRGLVSWAELQVSNAPRRGLLSWAELEVPTAPRRGLVSWAEFEVPTAPRRGLLSWAELELPGAPRRGLLSWAELEVPTAPRRGLLSWAEVEVPTAPRRGLLSWAEFEVPTAPRRGLLSWAEFEVPNAPRRGLLSWAELEVPTLGAVGDPVAQALIALLFADAPLVALVGAEIREIQWQGTPFAYPAVRVDLGDLGPQGTGPCAEAWSLLTFRISVFSNEDSSGECLDLLAAVQAALQRRRLAGPGFTSLEIKIDMTILPYPDDTIWRGEVALSTTIIAT